jgi:outer membrane protein
VNGPLTLSLCPLALLSLLAAAPALAQAAIAPAQAQPAPAEAPPAPAARPPLTLERALELAVELAHDPVYYKLQADIAEQALVTARSAVLPNLSFNASLGEVRAGGGAVLQTITDPTTGKPVDLIQSTEIFGNHSFGLSVRQLLFDGGAWWNNIYAATATFKSAEAAWAEQVLQARYLVEQAYYELLRAQRQLAVLGEAAARSRDQADFEQRLYEGGRAAQADVYAARANRDNDEVNRLGAEKNVELARFALATSIGLDPQDPLSVAEPPGLLDEPRAPPDGRAAVEKALSQRPSLVAFAKVVESQHKQVAAAGGGYWPTVSLNGSFGRNGARSVGDLLDPALDQKSTLAGSVNLTWNLFSGFATDASVRTQELQLRSAENDLASGRRGVASDVEKAVASLATARVQARVAAQAEETARQGLSLAKTRQGVGLGTELDVRDAELKLTQAQLAHVNALLDGREQESALRRAMGEKS